MPLVLLTGGTGGIGRGLMDWLALRHRKLTPVDAWPSLTNPYGDAVPIYEMQREAMAQTVERVATVVFVVVFAMGTYFFIQTRRRRLQHL